MIRWAAYWWRHRNWADMLASAARQLVWRYLSWRGDTHTIPDVTSSLISTVFLCFRMYKDAPTDPCARHVELDGADHHQDEQAAQRDLRQRALCVPRDVLQHLPGGRGGGE